jgi:hypothetical protein
MYNQERRGLSSSFSPISRLKRGLGIQPFQVLPPSSQVLGRWVQISERQRSKVARVKSGKGQEWQGSRVARVKSGKGQEWRQGSWIIDTQWKRIYTKFQATDPRIRDPIVMFITEIWPHPSLAHSSDPKLYNCQSKKSHNSPWRCYFPGFAWSPPEHTFHRRGQP